jgi:hypothetical protein
MTHCPQRELTGYLRFNLSHRVQSLILKFELSQVLLRIIGAAQSDRNLISAEESYPRHRQPAIRAFTIAARRSSAVHQRQRYPKSSAPGLCSLS